MPGDNKINKDYNPSDYDRYNILKDELKKENRIEDLENIIRLMSPPEEIINICKSELGKNIKVAIVGAGLSGLSAAFELKKIGCNVTIFEQSGRIGGRTYTYYFDRVNNKYGDFGETSIPISHYTTWHYINLFNLETEVINTDINYYYLRDSLDSIIENKKLKNVYAKYDLTEEDIKKLNRKDYLKVLNKYIKYLSPKEREELISIKEVYSKKIIELDKLTLKKIYEKEGYSEDAINLIGYLLGNKEYFNYSLIEILEQEYTLDFKNNYAIKGGMIKLPFAIYEALINNESQVYININKEILGEVDIKFGFSIEEIDCIEKINLKYKDLENNILYKDEFDYVIYTEPIRNLKRILIKTNISSVKLRAIDDINLVNSQKIYLYLKNKFWKEEGNEDKFKYGRLITDLPVYSIYYFSEKTNESVVLLASYGLSDKSVGFTNLDEEIKIQDTIKYIERIHNLPSGYIDSILLDYNVLSWEDIRYIWGYSTMFKPEEKTLYSYGISKPEFNNKLFFAGENTSGKHGTQQGELQSGMIVASKIVEEILKK
ncbi:FAD-dependent oxidoreductase [Clostridium sp. Sa3CUN1]|uniref:FAD-dependent oxidoreductase n=1 Tax=Clostridium gallinarum TaxID=2762246 RepID=A0ABR8Q3J6_9CLOT|nr:NAD(P)/FAD-dependent oxidoreductase [Clostridium gallinarum]MBD7914981.1 FAD-dependent oxidoreductase [Clostridium gallinarum]